MNLLSTITHEVYIRDKKRWTLSLGYSWWHMVTLRKHIESAVSSQEIDKTARKWRFVRTKKWPILNFSSTRTHGLHIRDKNLLCVSLVYPDGTSRHCASMLRVPFRPGKWIKRRVNNNLRDVENCQYWTFCAREHMGYIYERQTNV